MVTLDELRAMPATVRLCRNAPCWCGYHERLERELRRMNEAEGIRPWTQASHDSFLANLDGHRWKTA